MITTIRKRLTELTPARFPSNRPQASVLIALTDHDDPEVILTKRAATLSTHSGEIAFPGGKYDETDTDLLFTALREAHEEVGLLPSSVDVIGPLGQVLSKHGLQVTPWVGVVPKTVELVPNPGELDEVFSVPLSFFLADQRYSTDEIRFKGKSLYVPAWEYQGHIIWGLTAYMLVELLNEGCGADIPMKPRPEYAVRRFLRESEEQ
ncbi:CoA pyrophosphatase [Neptuniibacter pectenicola]|jgi:8-oxo-dGTP pyrophosphatase MutT (NUDIX family)|uniref:CoA pyrophosphatase n=1 Tax=Neptuniibacter pectenicola TaxID=1806669 RepID=A0ABU9TPP0_9GAMM|nr:CoA pyrophosphatase [Neptuniibacter pectenicola]KXJ57777.1 MAG: coenzyme A pyrophosphatase [Neptuniibacter sp. Phe_28]|tara:strand:+ start:1807 stop:2424 length:618 start_codon:yes stop_codon:yes gene_type:complete|eukprot:gnl/Carplike_NY0171/7970_a11046_162.p1 GENE.gnl/Carplike_NY0171/7970_a11046_162~~gnl/Carplike_NY0171/7970_a11046_162.p1  ORF type:complete len:206 (+),score=10.36 gnl/Carplike_NY0171/7970_a11046_162:99-716(+)